MKKISLIIILIIILATVGGGSFYGGMVYGKSNNKRFNFEGIGAPTGMGGGNNITNRQGGSTGEIISKDEQSITIKLIDGGSKIIFVSDSVEVNKYAAGSIADLQVGENVMVQGTANSDGSVTAKTIQIRPAAQNPSDLQSQQK
jgi:hypothetical protein